MASIPLPALDVRAPQQPDLLDKFKDIYALKQMANQRQLQQQQVQMNAQKLQQEQVQTQEAQQGQADQIAFRKLLADPTNKGKTIGEIADTAAQNNAISPQAWQQAKKLDLDQKKQLSELTEKDLANRKAAHDQTQQLFNNVMSMPDDQYLANWPQIAQQYDAIPGNNKTPLDPNKPLPKAQLQQFGPLIDMGNAYLDQEMARRGKMAETNAAEAKNQFAQSIGAPAGTSGEQLHIVNYLKAHQLPTTPENLLKAQDDYIEKTKIAPAQVRLQGLMNLPTEVADPNNPGETINVARKDAVGMKGRGSSSVQAVKAEQKYMTSGKGSQQLTAFNTAMTHLDVLDKAADDLNNSDLRVVNRAKQFIAEQTGNPAPANFAAAKNAMSGEVASALKASGATDQEIKHVGDTFDQAQSPAQLRGAIDTYRTLLRGKRDQLKQQWKEGMQGNPNFGEQPAPTAGGFSWDKYPTIKK